MWKWILLLALLSFAAHGEPLRDAPELVATDLDGETLVLDSLLSRGPVYVSFWAIWCKPCIRELDELSPVYERYRDRGFELIAVNQDGPRSQHRVKPMVRGKRWKFRVLLDPEKKLSRVFQVIALPTSFLIGQDGKIVGTRQGFKPGMEKLIEEELLQLLPEDEEEGSQPEEKNQDR